MKKNQGSRTGLLIQSKEANSYDREQSCEVPPASSLAFQFLADFCSREKIADDCIAALAMVLMLPDHDSLIKLPSVVTLPEVIPIQGHNDTFYDLLLMRLNSCITLSCTLNGIESLLCSVMFEPTVPCNLVEAQSLALTDVFESNLPNVTLLMAKSCRRTSLLWLAAARLNRVNRIWASIKDEMPQISLPVASWTGTLQSFVQARYILPENQGYISRAYEFSISYLIRPNVVVPFMCNPPFGKTIMSNLAFNIRDYLHHDHRPL